MHLLGSPLNKPHERANSESGRSTLLIIPHGAGDIEVGPRRLLDKLLLVELRVGEMC